MKISARGLARNRSPSLRAAWDQTTARRAYPTGPGGHAARREGGRAERSAALGREMWIVSISSSVTLSLRGQPGGGGGEEAELPIGPVSVGAPAVEVVPAVMVQVAALAQRSEVEQGTPQPGRGRRRAPSSGQRGCPWAGWG